MTVLVTVQVNEVVPKKVDGSVAFTVTEQVHGAVGVPVMAPVEALMVRPAGRPVADQVKAWPDWVSVALFVRVVMAVPVTPDWAVWPATATVLVMVQEKVVVPNEPAPSVAFTVTEQVHGAVGVPVMAPEVELIDRPAGSPVADQVKVWPDWVSVAELVRVVMAVPVTPDWAVWPSTATVLVMVQVTVIDPLKEAPSVALMVDEHEQAVVGVPVMVPVEALMDRPAGRPVADQVKVWPDWVSDALLVTAVMAVPETLAWAASAVTVTVLVTVQVNEAVPE